MTHDTGSTPRFPTEVPEVAEKPRATPTEAPEMAERPRAAAPDRAPAHGATDARAVDSGPKDAGTTDTARKPSGPPAGKPRVKAPAAAALPGDALPGDSVSGHRSSAGEGTPGAARPLFPDADHHRLSERLQHAVSEFVESPRRAVEEAESTFDTAVDGLTDALREYRRTLGTAGRDDDPGMRTEELRVTLQHYRDLTERLLNV
ncbi:hypothetical protein ABT025_04225 [Streptomyces sp. NPDC002809]|uniref:hypothetical protein n=1 Tax=Streptomyces sp. NPDC002809 TaxID=3154433 RepID=UPI0033319635